MDFAVLGPIEARIDGKALPIGGARERFLLATMLLNAGRPTPVAGLVNALWRDPPPTARSLLHELVHEVFDGLGANRLVQARSGGYQLDLDGHWLDVTEFRLLVGRGRRAAADGDHPTAAALLGQALALWRGPALADLSDELAAGMRPRLNDERVAATEAMLDAELAMGHYEAVLCRLSALIAEQPYRERLYRTRMLALVGSGRRADALRTYHQVYRRFVDDLGVEPGPMLRELERRIARG